MKIFNLLLIYCFALCLSVSGQARKPKLMVLPSDAWCINKGYVQEYNGKKTPDYKMAVQNDQELNNVIAKIGILMTDRGFPLHDLAQSLKSVQNSELEDVLVTNQDGSGLAESPLDLLLRKADADIVMELDWTVNKTGPKRAVTYNLKGLDAYTNKQIAGAQGTGAPSFAAEIPVLLEEAVLVNMDNFTHQLQRHFDDLMQNGREVVVEVRVSKGSEIDLETEYDDYELAEIIENWMAEHTVNRRFSKSGGTENQAVFDQVRIPLFRDNGLAMDTESFTRTLMRFLRKDPYNLTCRVVNRGLGRSILVIGQ